MTNKEIVMDILSERSCLTGVQIHDYAYQKFGESISPQAVAGVLRPMTNKGQVAVSRHPFSNRSVYWFTEKGKADIAKGVI